MSNTDVWHKKGLIKAESTDESIESNAPDVKISTDESTESNTPDVKVSTDESTESNTPDAKVSADEKSTATALSKPKLKVKLMLFTVITIISVLGGAYGYVELTQAARLKSDQLESLLSKASIQKAELERVEGAFVDVVDNELRPLIVSFAEFERKDVERQVKSKAFGKSLADIRLLLTDMQGKLDFKNQLIDVLLAESDSRKIKMNDLESKLAQAISKLNDKGSTGKYAPQAKTKELPSQLKDVNGYSLFSIDVWGDVRYAVFTKGQDIIKLGVQEKIEGYYLESIDFAKEEIHLSKKSKKYFMGVR